MGAVEGRSLPGGGGMRALTWMFCLLAIPAAVALGSGSPYQEAGRFFAQSFATHALGMNPQNWDVAQDTLGLIYVGNTEGLYQYDGVRWRHIPVRGKSIVRALHLDREGRILVGTHADFGYLTPDSAGSPVFHSLLAGLHEPAGGFGDIFDICETSQGAYFRAPERIFRWSRGAIRAWESAGEHEEFSGCFAVGDVCYVNQAGRGLCQMAGDSLALVPGGEQFTDGDITVMLPASGGRILVGTRLHGAYWFDGAGFVPLAGSVHSLLKAKQIYDGALLADGQFALATLRGGVLILDAQGALLRVEDKSTGLINDMVLGVFTDREGALWVASDDGITRLELPSPLTQFGEADGIRGSVEAITRHRRVLYLATSWGVYRSRSGEGRLTLSAGASQCPKGSNSS